LRRSGGGFTTFLTLVLALLAAAFSGYVWWRLIWLDTAAADKAVLEAQTRSLDQKVAGISDQVTARVDQELGPELQNLGENQQSIDQRLQAMETAVANLLTDQARAVPASVDDWKIAEAGFLLRIAEERISGQGDVRGAVTLLRTADQRLTEVAGAGYTPVREAIANSLLALEAAGGGVDVQGTFVAIEALKDRAPVVIGAAPASGTKVLPAGGQPDEKVAAEEKSAVDQLFARLTELVRIRRVDAERVKPLPAEEDRVHLERSIQSALDQAQLGLLRRDQVIYDTSLGNAESSFAAASGVMTTDQSAWLDSLRTLRHYEIQRKLPDLGATLRAFDAARGNATGSQP
jgi:uroporphyrin-3 C-methyltransferase